MYKTFFSKKSNLDAFIIASKNDKQILILSCNPVLTHLYIYYDIIFGLCSKIQTWRLIFDYENAKVYESKEIYKKKIFLNSVVAFEKINVDNCYIFYGKILLEFES